MNDLCLALADLRLSVFAHYFPQFQRARVLLEHEVDFLLAERAETALPLHGFRVKPLRCLVQPPCLLGVQFYVPFFRHAVQRTQLIEKLSEFIEIGFRKGLGSPAHAFLPDFAPVDRFGLSARRGDNHEELILAIGKRRSGNRFLLFLPAAGREKQATKYDKKQGDKFLTPLPQTTCSLSHQSRIHPPQR